MPIFRRTYAQRRIRPIVSVSAAATRDVHSFPTRRSSDLHSPACPRFLLAPPRYSRPNLAAALISREYRGGARDRKSTRLNSSHMSISYAVFCFKKKTADQIPNAAPLSTIPLRLCPLHLLF